MVKTSWNSPIPVLPIFRVSHPENPMPMSRSTTAPTARITVFFRNCLAFITNLFQLIESHLSAFFGCCAPFISSAAAVASFGST